MSFCFTPAFGQDSVYHEFADRRLRFSSCFAGDRFQCECKDGKDPYFEGVRKAYPFDVRITDGQIDSLMEYDLPVTVRYAASFPLGTDDHLYINPMMGQGIKYNPFSAATRSYPIELPFAQIELFVCQMDIPKGYELEELPKSARVKLNDSDGSYAYLIGSDGA